MIQNTCKLEGGSIAYWDNGVDTDIAVLFLHGNSMDAMAFENQIRSNKFDSFHVLAPDLPGHGHSFLQEYSINSLVDALVEFCNSLVLDKIILVGHSFGGHLAIHILPGLKNCVGLFLIGTSPLGSFQDIPYAYQVSPTFSLFFKGKLETSERREMARIMVGEASYDGLKAIDRTQPDFRSGISSSLEKGEMLNEIEILRNSGIDASVFLGSHDLLARKEYLNRLQLQGIIKNLVILQFCGHSPHLENPEKFNSCLSAYLQKLSTRLWTK